MIKIIRVRKECPEIGWGSWQKISIANPHVLGLVYEWRGTRVVTLHNFSREPQQVRFTLEGEESNRLVNLWSQGALQAGRSGRHTLTLGAFDYHWYRVGGLNYGLRRTREGPGAAD
jgi:maltose alpha-D-glucosyltransferase/alpha-amylase